MLPVLLVRNLLQLSDQIVFRNNHLIYGICLLPAIIIYITLFTCYKLAFHYKRFPDWVYVPWISFTGVNDPEYNTFAIGFTVAGLCLILVNRIFTTKLLNNKLLFNRDHMNLNLYVGDVINYLLRSCTTESRQRIHYYMNQWIEWMLSYCLIITSICASIQAWINVDNEMVIVFCSPAMQTMSWYPGANAVIHIACACVAYGAMFWHNLFVTLRINHGHHKWLRISFYYKLLLLCIGSISGFFCCWNLFYVSFIVNPYPNQDAFRFGLNNIGICQYITTIVDCLFWVSFGFDHYVITNKHSTAKSL